MSIKVCFLVPVIVSLICCRSRPLPDHAEPVATEKLKYARGFEIAESGDQIKLCVKNPWQQAENITYEYRLGRAKKPDDDAFPEHRCFAVPVKKVVCLSSTFIGFIELLGREQTIIGISGKRYVTCASLQERIASGEIADIGYDGNLNYEILVQLQPDVVFLYGITGSVSAVIARMDELGIRSAVIGEYLEESPLARMEWIKYIGAFYGLSNESEAAFDSVETRYLRLAALASGQRDRPSVMLGLPWSGTWYVSGGQSYIAGIIRDAGGRYLWDDLPYKDSQPINPEKVFERACQADFWLNAGDADTRADILKADSRLGHIKAFRENAVYNNNNRINQWGGNAYFEQGVVEPDIILADILSVLHPHLLPSHQRKYYRKLD